MSADDDLTELGQQGGDTFDVRYDQASHTVTINGADGPESFTVDPTGDWRQQAALEMATRGYGARWSNWEYAHDGGAVMSAARASYPDQADDGPGWEAGAATYSAAAAAAPETPAAPPVDYTPPEYGRVRVYPQYTFPVYQSGVGGIGLDQEITVTDWDKQGRDWAEAEARRQVAEALGGPPNEDGIPGGPWWMGQATKGEHRWRPVKGTPRSAKPNDGLPEPLPWRPWRPAETETDPVSPDEKWPAGYERDISPAEYDRQVAEAAAAGTPFVLDAREVQPGDQVLYGEDLARVAEVDGDRVTIDHGRELTPGVPGSRRSSFGRESLLGGPLRKVPNNATYASLEDRRPPAEQAARYAERRAHYDEMHGPGKRGKKGWTAHKRGCRTCADIDDGGDGTGRRLHAVPPAPASVPAETAPVSPAETAETAAPAPAGGAEDYPVRFTWAAGSAGDTGEEVRHWRWEAALDALQDHVGAWTIPDDGTGVLDVDSFISSIGGYVQDLAGVMGQLGEQFSSGETPIAPVVGETLADFAGALGTMAGEAAEVHERWQGNEDNAHDLRRARGEIPGAHLFNVAPAA
jgi:hypothetical protein